MKEIKTSKGVLKYRLPSVAEGLKFMAMAEKMSNAKDYFFTLSEIIENLENLVDYKSLGYANYKECNEDIENMFQPLREVAEDIIKTLTEVFAKKP